MESRNSILRQLPKVDEVLKISEIEQLAATYPRELVVEVIRTLLDEVRQKIMANRLKEDQLTHWTETELQRRILSSLQDLYKPKLRKVINAAGVVLHTNLGRAVLSRSAIEAMVSAVSGYCNLELNLDTGKRGSRYAPMEELLTRLTGAPSSLVVNNNAAAVLLALGTLAKGQEVIVSRGQLVEIGGSFRIPEVMEQSGAILREVGSTNKTYLDDYRRAINEKTALLLHVHTSNYRIVGFTRETTVEDLVTLGKETGIPVMSDLGSGSLLSMERFGLPLEPTVQQTVANGADVITFSGDKLLGGPQSGIILGRKDLLDKMKKNPLTRALRIDKMTVAALEATLREYLDEKSVLENIPVLRMLQLNPKQLQEKAEFLSMILKNRVGDRVSISLEKETSAVGGGAMPTSDLPSWLVAVRPRAISVEELSQHLRQGHPAVIGRVKDDRLMLDVRTLLEGEENLLVDALDSALGGGESK